MNLNLNNIDLSLSPKLLLSNTFIIKDKMTGEFKLLPLQTIASLLVTDSCFKDLKVFYKIDKSYLYVPNEGVYMEINNTALEFLLRRFTQEVKIVAFTPMPSLTKLVKELKGLNAQLPLPIIDRYIIMNNGALNLKDLSLTPYSPSIFALNKLSISYLPEALCPEFLIFLNQSIGNDKKIQFIQAFNWAILHSHVDSQVFVYLLGKGGTGKSTLANIMKCLIGENNVLTTTLRDLHNDKFEAYNIIGKKLILISDTEHYQGDLSVLKSISGGDALQGRIKHQTGSYEIHASGLVLITGNTPLGSRDSGGAISRRARVITMDFKPTHATSLISYQPNRGWEGVLVNEMPGILNWALNSDSNLNKQLLKNTFNMIPEMDIQLKITQEELNPVLRWIREMVTRSGSDSGSFVGHLNTPNIEKLIIDLGKRKTLYPSYYLYMKRNGLNPLNNIRFVRELIYVCDSEGLPITKIKKSQGIYIKGIVLKKESLERDVLMGGPLVDLETSESLETSEQANPEKVNSLRDDLYVKYIKCLGRTSFKDEINKISRSIANELDPLEMSQTYLNTLSGLSALNETGEVMHIPSETYKTHVMKLYKTSIDKIKMYGVIPYKYKQMGLSPRIIPQNYGNSFNSIKKQVRYEMLERLTPMMKQNDYVIIDVDLKSCYTSIVLGLYPKELEVLQRVIEGKGLWKHIEQEFVINKKHHLFNKPVVKICTYSSFFLGGNKAMINGTLEYFRKELGMTQNEFRNTPLYEGLYNRAQEVATLMQNSKIINDFRQVSEYIFQSSENDYLAGPTKHKYFVTKDTFLAAYPNYLQSYEFALLSESTLRLIDHDDRIILMGHFHDGNILAVPKRDLKQITDRFDQVVYELGQELGLLYPQKLEIKIIGI